MRDLVVFGSHPGMVSAEWSFSVFGVSDPVVGLRGLSLFRVLVLSLFVAFDGRLKVVGRLWWPEKIAAVAKAPSQ